MKFDVPILLVTFNRPDTTEIVLNEIAKLKPSKLYISSDAARPHKAGEQEKVNASRRLIETHIHWDCEIQTLFHTENQGCRKGVSGAVNWLFENEEQGIVLEDDCLPSQSFFQYCKDLLDYYEHHDRVMVISGDNFQDEIQRGEASYYFSQINHCWGWATWKHKWAKFHEAIEKFEFFTQNLKAQYTHSEAVNQYWHNIFVQTYNKQIDSWAYLWTMAGFVFHGLTCLPNKNLIKNIGIGHEDAVHTTNDDQTLSIDTYELEFPLKHPEYIHVDREAENYSYINTFGLSQLYLKENVKITNADLSLVNNLINHSMYDNAMDRLLLYLDQSNKVQSCQLLVEAATKSGQHDLANLIQSNINNSIIDIINSIDSFRANMRLNQNTAETDRLASENVKIDFELNIQLHEIQVLRNYTDDSKTYRVNIENAFNKQNLSLVTNSLPSLSTELELIFQAGIYNFTAKNPEPYVIDGGAHIGSFSLFAKMKYPNVKVVGFEPEDNSWRFLQQNVPSHLNPNIKFVKAGLFGYDGEIAFESDNCDGSTIKSSNSNTKIDVCRLSQYIDRPVDFMKLNIEGAELEVFVELGDKLKLIDELCIEYHGFPEVGQRLHLILEILDRYGFRYVVHDLGAMHNPKAQPPFSLNINDRFFQIIYAQKVSDSSLSNFETNSKTGTQSVSTPSSIQNPSLKPTSDKFGFDRGTPIDRIYIENFLQSHSSSIKGNVLEIADNTYTTKFGSSVTKSDILHATNDNPKATIIGDLSTGLNIPENRFDNIILTQTLPFILNFKDAIANAHKSLKDGGSILATVSGLSQISRYDMDRWGEYWRFTNKSMEIAFEEYFGKGNVEVSTFGNVYTAREFLDGKAAEEIDPKAFTYQDPDYQIIIAIKATKSVHAFPGNDSQSNSALRQDLPNPAILLYHRVGHDPIDSQLLCIEPEKFEAHIKYITENYRVIPLNKMLQEKDSGILNKSSVSITFDDGYLDNLEIALPILEKYNAHATIFITSGMVNKEYEFWWDGMEKIFLGDSPIPSSISLKLENVERQWPLTSKEQKTKAWEEMCSIVRNFPAQAIYDFLDNLYQWANVERKARTGNRIINTDQLKALDQSPYIEIGAHTVTHSRLSQLSEEEQRNEITRSKRALETILGHAIPIFSYPFGGVSDFDEISMKIVQSCGFSYGIANSQDYLSNSYNSFNVPRFLVRNWELEDFKEWLPVAHTSPLENQTVSKRNLKLGLYS